jgi:asparagine synthase (glutamine-hydrolysing)
MKLGFKDSEVDRLLLIDAVSADDIDLAKEFFETSPLADELARTQYTDIKMVLEGDMFAQVDRMTMLNSLESRTPLISNEIVEFAYNIPLDYKLDGKNKKKILKETFVDLLPEGYDKLPKKGFGVPLDHWFRNEMKEELTDLLSAERIKKQGIFDAKYVENIVAEHMSGKMNRKGELWSLYVFEKWMDNVGGNI